jgi:diaminopimelate decarboxylase
MEFLPSEYFTYRDNELYCEEVPFREILEQYGTPAYVYSERYFVDRYKKFDAAFAEIPHRIFYAVKSNFNLSVIKLFAELGAGADVNSMGEYLRARKAGLAPKDVLLTGVGKTDEEIRRGIEDDLAMIKVESYEELRAVNEIARELGKVAPVAVRVNPDVDPKTHPYITTGLKEGKFGVSPEEARRMYADDSLEAVKFVGIDTHIGSQISSVEPYVETVEKMAATFRELRDAGVPLEHLDLGGGYGVRYENEDVFPVEALAERIVPILKPLECEVYFEPGRYLTANAGALGVKVLYVKKAGAKTVAVTDGAMTELFRPALYGAYHHVQPITQTPERDFLETDVVGPVCETADFIGRGRRLREVRRGEYLAACSAGSYGMTMSSNYNGRRRAPEIIVSGAEVRVARSREEYDSLLWDEAERLG